MTSVDHIISMTLVKQTSVLRDQYAQHENSAGCSGVSFAPELDLDVELLSMPHVISQIVGVDDIVAFSCYGRVIGVPT